VEKKRFDGGNCGVWYEFKQKAIMHVSHMDGIFMNCTIKIEFLKFHVVSQQLNSCSFFAIRICDLLCLPGFRSVGFWVGKIVIGRKRKVQSYSVVAQFWSFVSFFLGIDSL